MSITVYAFTDDRAELLVKKATFWNDAIAAEAVADVWKAEGYVVSQEEES